MVVLDSIPSDKRAYEIGNKIEQVLRLQAEANELQWKPNTKVVTLPLEVSRRQFVLRK